MANISTEEMELIVKKHAALNAAKYKGVAQVGSVMTSIMSTEPEMRKHAREIKPMVEKYVNFVNAMDMDEITGMIERTGASFVKTREDEVIGLPDLPGTTGIKKTIFRLAPYPSGPLHIGNARMVALNGEYAKLTNGKIVLCFDDTIGAMKKDIESNRAGAKYVVPEAYDMIREGLEWFGIKWHQEFYKSDRLPIYYEYCYKVIKMGVAYACNCDASVFRDLKNNGIPCPHRDMSVQETLRIFDAMLAGSFDEGSIVIRMKTGLDLKDPALREPVIMRISYANHPRVGNKYCVWPLLEFSWGIDDHEFGITHIIRGKDLYKEDFIEEFMWDLFGWKRKIILHYGIISFQGLKLSKTHAREMINAGEYIGWDDPRTWSLQSLARRGFKPDALRKTLLAMKLSLNDVDFPYGMLYAENKKMIADSSYTISFVPNPVKITVQGLTRTTWEIPVPVNVFNKEMGNRAVFIKGSQGKKTLFVPEDVIPMLGKGPVKLNDLFSIVMKNDEIWMFASSPRDIKQSSSWVDSKGVNISVFMPDGTVVDGKAEPLLRSVPTGNTVYLDRFGFVRLDDVCGNTIQAWFAH